MTLRQALDFIRYHGVVLEAAKGAEPSLVRKVTGDSIKGSWWENYLYSSTPVGVLCSLITEISCAFSR